MALEEIRIPLLGEGIDGGDVINVLVATGDSVSTDQPLIEMETGKATVDVPTSHAGTIKELRVTPGERKKVGDVIAVIETGAAAAPAAAPVATEPVKAKAAAPAPVAEAPAPVATAPTGSEQEIDLVIPPLGEGVTGGTVLSIHVKAGEVVEKDQAVFELETGKATVEWPAPHSGTLLELSVTEGAQVVVGQKIGRMKAVIAGGTVPVAKASPAPAAPSAPIAMTTASAPAVPASAPVPATPSRPAHAPIPASPSVRKFARELGLDITQITGTGANGRLSIEDVKAYSRRKNAGGGAIVAAPGVVSMPLPDFSKFGEIERENMNAIRKITVQHMAGCWATIPHVTQHDDADVTALENLRKRFARKAEAKGVKLTVTAVLIKVLADALKAFPKFNASIDVAQQQVVLKKYVHIGVAVDTPKGLLVPVIRDADKKSVFAIAQDLKELADKVKSGKISPAELQGGSMTITNLGGLGGKYFTPIVNHPEVAILGVGRADIRPVYGEGGFSPRLMMPLSLSYDHRLIDGADGTRFLRWLIDAIELPLFNSLETES